MTCCTAASGAHTVNDLDCDLGCDLDCDLGCGSLKGVRDDGKYQEINAKICSDNTIPVHAGCVGCVGHSHYLSNKGVYCNSMCSYCHLRQHTYVICMFTLRYLRIIIIEWYSNCQVSWSVGPGQSVQVECPSQVRMSDSVNPFKSIFMKRDFTNEQLTLK